jgi:hypothetical protein
MERQVLQVNLKNSTSVGVPAERFTVDGSVASSLFPRGVTTYTGVFVAGCPFETGAQDANNKPNNPIAIINKRNFMMTLLHGLVYSNLSS